MWGNLDFSALGLGFSLGGAEIRVLNAKREVFFESFPGHIHGFYELHYVFGGRGELDCLGKRIPLGEGVLYLCGPHVSHEQLTDPADNMMEYSFSFDVIRSG
ncbi:MAG: AraC family ligand binding domain-containing protein, partial [Clostridia bacterium]|nr:AraC family ligand binding domain-containing protein [Clostridia bacterium]